MRQIRTLKTGFRFQKFPLGGVDPAVFSPAFDDSDWREIRVPHDWGIEGEFSPDNDPTERLIEEDGMTKAIRHTGRSGGLPTVGEGVYRTRVELDAIETVVLELDGVMWQSEVWVNGQRAGGCHFGYLSFEVDLTPFVTPGENLIAIHATVPPECSRWYSGAGLYRNLRLVEKPKAHILYNGVWVRQIYADAHTALLDLTVEAVGARGFSAKITAPDGSVTELESENELLSLRIDDPILWDVDAPKLYTAAATIPGGDSVEVRFGIRTCAFTKDGFFLNGRRLKMNGVCMHHDLGSIGAAVNHSAMRRQLEILQGMGVNAIRTSHNPPAPDLLELCDEYGFLVMDEFFDEWSLPKVTNGYHLHFREHAMADMEAIIRRDRNHPSVVMWSIGNEIQEQRSADGWQLTHKLSDAVRALDPTRPVTAGCDRYPHCFDNRFAFYLDVVGLNYKPHFYPQVKADFPNVPLIGSETASCISTRGVYELPAEVAIGLPKNEQLTESDYGLSAPRWAYYAERELAAQRDCEYVMGEFIWTGFDYLGEPTPYYAEWPSRSSYFGVVDLAGLPKNRYYGYRAAWTDLPTLHVFPHWNWEGMEGKVVPVHVYTNYEEVELLVNGVSQGRRRHATEGNDVTAQLERFRLMWNDVVYAPGEITAIAYRDGQEVDRTTVRTAKAPHHVVLEAYRGKIAADGESLNYVTATVVDCDGVPCPRADQRLSFCAEGAADVYATDAGDQRETECFLRPDKRALSGKLVCCLRAKETAGSVRVTCSGEGLLPGTLTFDCV